MNLPRFPLIPTIVVLAAVATMIALGFWQLGKVEGQNSRLAQYEENSQSPTPVEFPISKAAVDRSAYRLSSVQCERVASERVVAGRNSAGRSGLVVIATCKAAGGREIDVQLGWTSEPRSLNWNGGLVSGRIEPLRTGFAKLVADPPVAPLTENAPPSKHEVNHLAYAGQWFFFALAALVIYLLALKRQQRGSGG